MDIIGKKWLYFIFSAMLIIPGIISLMTWGIKPGIDFTGGTLLEIQIRQLADKNQEIISHEQIKNAAKSQNIEVGSIQPEGNNTFLLRLKPIDNEQNRKLQEELKKEYGDVEEIRFETVGPTVGSETTQKAIKATAVATLAIVVYIAWAFRQIPKPYSSIKFGISVAVALLHDILVIVGLFSLLGHFAGVEIDSLFLTALLTVMGFSVHDTIVVFDRIRENLVKMAGSSFTAVVNESILQTLVRSLSTSLTVLFTLSALLIFGGESIRWFILTLLIGITSGTYSSIFNAAPFLVVWEEYSRKVKDKR